MTKAAAGVITHEVYRRTSLLFWRHTTSVGVLSGGVSRTELENARAAMVFANAEDLLRHIEETPIAWLATHRILLIRTGWAQSELGLGPSLLTSY